MQLLFILVLSALQAPLKPLQPSPAVSARHPPTNEGPLIVFDISEEQNCPQNSSAPRCPVPKPRTKSNLRPVARDSHVKEQNSWSSPVAAQEEAAPSRPLPLWEGASRPEGQATMNTMSTEQGRSTVISRIKALEGQTSTESLGLPKKPEIVPRTVPPRPAVSSGKPSVAPKPAANRASGEWDSWTASRLRGGPTPHSPPKEARSSPVTKPELPKKPNPGLIRSINLESLGGGPTAESPNGGKKAPTPAPRPLLPKKSVSSENAPCSVALLKPVTVPPRLSVASQAKAFRSLGEGPPASQCPECDTLRGLLPERLNPLAVSACFYLHTRSHSTCVPTQACMHICSHTHTLTQACTHIHLHTLTFALTQAYTHSHTLTHTHTSPQPRLDPSRLMPGPFPPPVPLKGQPSGAL